METHGRVFIHGETWGRGSSGDSRQRLYPWILMAEVSSMDAQAEVNPWRLMAEVSSMETLSSPVSSSIRNPLISCPPVPSGTLSSPVLQFHQEPSHLLYASSIRNPPIWLSSCSIRNPLISCPPVPSGTLLSPVLQFHQEPSHLLSSSSIRNPLISCPPVPSGFTCIVTLLFASITNFRSYYM